MKARGRLCEGVPDLQHNLYYIKMYRRELNYWDLQQRGIGPVEQYPVSQALASIEGQQLIGSAFDELAKRQQTFLAAEDRGLALRKPFKNYTTSIEPIEPF